MKRLTCFVLLGACVSAWVLAVPQTFKKDLNELNKKISSTKTAISARNSKVQAADINALEKEARELAKKAGVNEKDPDIAKALESIAECRKLLEQRIAREKAAAEKASQRQATQAAKEEEERKKEEADKARAAQQEEKAAAERRKRDEEYKPLSELLAKKRGELLQLSDLVKRMAEAKSDEELINLARDANVILPRAKELHKAFTEKNLPLGRFEELDPAAKEIGAARLIGALGHNLDQVDRMLDTLRRTLVNRAVGEFESMKAYDKIDLVNASYEKILTYFEVSERLFPKDGDAAEAKKNILPQAKKILDEFKTKVAQARMAKDQYGGPDGEQIRATMKKLYETKYPEDKVLRVVITSPSWEGQARATVDNDGTIKAGYYQYLYAQVAAKKPTGVVVYNLGYRRQWTGSGNSFGPLSLHSIGSSYPIQEANVNR